MFTLKNFGAEKFESKLKNGIRIVLFYRPNTPIYTEAFLHSGSSFDPVGKEGMAHLIEHMIVNGSTKFPSKDILSEHIESTGGMLGARTNSEAIMIDTEVPDKEDFSKAVDIFESCLCNPLLDRKVFETEKDVVIKEITKSQSNPEKVLFEATSKLLLKNTPFEHVSLGTIESVSSITHNEMLNHYKKLFDCSRITFIASGDISIEELTNKLNTLNFISGNPYEKNTKEIDTRATDKINTIFMDLKQTSIYMGFYNAPIFSKESLCISLAGNILASGRTSRLVKRLRYERGLIYSVSSSGYSRLPISVYGIKTDTSEDKVQSVIDEILKEIQNIHDNGVTEKELDFVKNKLVKSLKRSMQTSESWVDFHGYGEALGHTKYRPIHEYANQIVALSLKDINETITKYISPEQMYISLVGKAKIENIKLYSASTS